MNTQSTVRLVIGVLGAVAIINVIGGILLTLNDKAMPDAQIAIASLAVGAVAGILSRTGDTDVRVVNEPNDPVPVADDRGQSVLGIAVLALVVACVALALILL